MFINHIILILYQKDKTSNNKFNKEIALFLYDKVLTNFIVLFFYFLFVRTLPYKKSVISVIKLILVRKLIKNL